MALRISSTLVVVIVLMIASSLRSFAYVDDPVKLLPRDRAVEEWMMEGPEVYYYDFSLERVVDQLTNDVVLEYGFVSMLSQFYILGEDLMEICIYEMEDAGQAFGIFSVFADIPKPLEPDEMIFLDRERDIQNSTTEESRWVGANEYHLIGDNYFVQMTTPTDNYKNDLLRLGGKIKSKFDTSGGEMPGEDLLLGENRIYNSGRIIAGKASLGLYLNLGRFDPFMLEDTGARCLMWEYHQQKGKIYKQVVFEYDDEDIAKDAYLSFRDWVDSVVYYRRVKIADAIGTIFAEDEYENYLGVYRDENLLRLFLNFDDIDEMSDTIKLTSRGD